MLTIEARSERLRQFPSIFVSHFRSRLLKEERVTLEARRGEEEEKGRKKREGRIEGRKRNKKRALLELQI